jgi:hypothetical protein
MSPASWANAGRVEAVKMPAARVLKTNVGVFLSMKYLTNLKKIKDLNSSIVKVLADGFNLIPSSISGLECGARFKLSRIWSLGSYINKIRYGSLRNGTRRGK